jgi:hypothetical protein
VAAERHAPLQVDGQVGDDRPPAGAQPAPLVGEPVAEAGLDHGDAGAGVVVLQHDDDLGALARPGGLAGPQPLARHDLDVLGGTLEPR